MGPAQPTVLAAQGQEQSRTRSLTGRPARRSLRGPLFDAQQATEKALKAILVQHKAAFPRTHALADLLTLVAKAGVDLPADVADATVLTPYAVETRYPGLWEEVTAADHAEAVRVAERVVGWAEAIVGGGDS